MVLLLLQLLAQRRVSACMLVPSLHQHRKCTIEQSAQLLLELHTLTLIILHSFNTFGGFTS